MAISFYFISAALIVSSLTSDPSRDGYNPKYCIDFSTVWPFYHSKFCRNIFKLPPAANELDVEDKSDEKEELKLLNEEKGFNEDFVNVS